MADPVDLADVADLADVVARFAGACHAAGLPVGPDRAERFARAITVAAPSTVAGLRACAHVTLSLNHDDDALVDRVFDAIFGGFTDPADSRGDPNAPPVDNTPFARSSGNLPTTPRSPAGPPSAAPTGSRTTAPGEATEDGREIDMPSAGSEAERLHHREFGELTPEELVVLAAAMARLQLATPDRASRRNRRSATGHRIDMAATLRLARRSGGQPLRLVRRRERTRPRKLVVLCDISGSMEPYARAMLQLLYCAAGATKAEVFVFATQLTRLTPVLAHTLPGPALADAGSSAPDWSGGTRIGGAIHEFLERYGRRGMARGAVVLIISDGWETGDAAELGREMGRLSRLAYRIVWVNPRTQSPRYQPLVGGMAAAWPFCDAVVSAHRMDALDDLVTALAAPARHHRQP